MGITLRMLKIAQALEPDRAAAGGGGGGGGGGLHHVMHIDLGDHPAHSGRHGSAKEDVPLCVRDRAGPLEPPHYLRTRRENVPAGGGRRATKSLGELPTPRGPRSWVWLAAQASVEHKDS